MARKKVFRALLRSKAGVRLNRDQLIEFELSKKTNALSFETMEAGAVLEKIEERISNLSKQSSRNALVSALLIGILFLSLKGVEFEITLLGAKLSNLSNIKEFVLLAASFGGVLFFVTETRQRELKALRKLVFIRAFGEDMHQIVQTTFESRDEHEFYLRDGRSFTTIGLKRFLDHLHAWMILSSILAVVVFALWVLGFILVDVWREPNINHILAKAICIFAAVSVLYDLLNTVLQAFASFTYIDTDRWDNYDLVIPGTKELSDETKEFFENYYRAGK